MRRIIALIHYTGIALALILFTACVNNVPISQVTSEPTPTATQLSIPTDTPVRPVFVTPTNLPSTAMPEPTAVVPMNVQRSQPSAPLPLSAYPRPKGDNGLGIHWSTHLYAQSDEATEYFADELAQMNITWVKLLVDRLTNLDHDPTIDALVARGIMPIIRIYQRCNDPYDPVQLENLVRYYVGKGVYYYDTYNEPNLPGDSGGWCEDSTPQPEYLAQTWAESAKIIYRAGGYPGLPSFFAPSQKRDNWQNDFFYRFFFALRQAGNEDVLYYSWASIHNYNINHPPTNPYDNVNLTNRVLTEEEIEHYQLAEAQVVAINRARQTAREPGGFFLGDNLYDDSTNFFHFIAYRNQFHDFFGFDIPMISTEGGATVGSSEDPRYPAVDARTVAEWTLWSADYMLDDAPDYYFATSTWLLAQNALDYPDPVWEAQAWYHDRNGGYEPVVEALKQRPRLTETRTVTSTPRLTATLPLTAYPRPSTDNGRGLHGSPSNQPLPPEVTDYFVAELKAMKITWFKFLQDDLPIISDPYLVEQLVAHDIEPIMRVYKPFNDRYEHLPELVTQATAMGVNYFELYNEPNLAGPAGGWRDGEPIRMGKIVEYWILAAREVHAAGGHPSLPPLAGGGTVDDMIFLREFLSELRARQQHHLFQGAWLAVHNYFLNHPLDYPADPVNVNDVLMTEDEKEARQLSDEQWQTINLARQNAKLPREKGGFWVGNTIDEDSNSFGKFEAYANIFRREFGYVIPVISTEGGAILGAAQDPRYPPINEDELTTMTLAAYAFMESEAPDYFFAHTPWLMANSAAGGTDARFENAAWYKDRDGGMLSVVDVLKE